MQAKYKVGQASDCYEQEADRVAEQVIRAPAANAGAAIAPGRDIPQIQKMCPDCEEELRREPTDEECEEELRRQPKSGEDLPPDSNSSAGHSLISSPALESDLKRLGTGGDSLSPSEQNFFEPRFGRDFSQVRIHTDSEAARSARAVNAVAFTMGRHIAFADGMYNPETQAGKRLLAHELTHVVQQGRSAGIGGEVLQRQTPEPDRAGAPQRDTSGATGPGRGPLIVEDDSPEVQSGQMRKSEFLSHLRTEVCAQSNDAMKGTGRSTEGCPYVDRWFGYYADKDNAYIERALRKFAPETSVAASATDYIPLVAARVKRSVEVWAQTGEITGVPDELAGAVMGGGILGAIGSVVSGIGSAIGSVISGVGSVISGIGRLLFKARDGGANLAADAGSVSGGLGRGETLQSDVTNRMEGAFGREFSNVRVHTDAGAARVTDGLNARALTVGRDIAFGSGEYQPGTPIGDALIAHELAHVIQQGDGGAHGGPIEMEGSRDAMEEEADTSAVTAVARLWNGAASGARGIGRSAMPHLRSGLRLQRCPRRTTPVTPREADKYIRDQFGPNVAGAIAAGISAEASDIKFVDEARFARAFECANKFYAAQGSPPDDTPVNQVIAFVDPHPLTPRRVYVCTTRRTADTIIHEALHLYTSPEWRMPQRVNEGTTEYFTRRIADQQHTQIFEKAYPCSFKAVASLVRVVHEEPLRRAYFQGDVDALKTAVNAGRPATTFDDWVFKVALAEYERARGLIGLSEESEC